MTSISRSVKEENLYVDQLPSFDTVKIPQSEPAQKKNKSTLLD
jgi:hypothetical protein